MFFLVALLIWAALHVYVAQRVISGFELKGSWRVLVIVDFAILGPSLILAAVLERFHQSTLVRWYSILSTDWVGVLFLTFVCLLFVDIMTGFGYIFPRYALRARRYAVFASLALCCIAELQGMRAPEVRRYEVQVRNLPKSLDRTSVVLVSDFHVGTTLGREWLEPRIEEIRELRPDMIVLAGDMVEGHGTPPTELRGEFAKLWAPLGVWAVNGNHERYGDATSFLQSAGARVLHNEWKEIQPGLVIAGVDDLSEHDRSAMKPSEKVRMALGTVPQKTAVLFVSHSPSLPELAAELHAGLMLSGHTHNGQIWPFNYIVKMFFPRIHGEYDVNGMPLIVCAGTGTWGPRMRLWSRSEIVNIVLRSPAS